MTPLPTMVRKGGFELTLVLRTGRVAIYRQHRQGAAPDHDAYEVILPQVRNTNHEGQPVEPYEGYPSSESWGKKGWTFTNLDKAVQKLLQFAQKASCAGTVSRMNRFNGQESSEGSLLTRPSRIGACENNVVPPFRQSRPNTLQRKIGLLSAHIPCLETANT